MEKLKPCPFCGGKAKVKAAKKDSVGFTIWCECEKCHAQVPGYCPNMRDEDFVLENIDSCRKGVIKVWNRRAKGEVD